MDKEQDPIKRAEYLANIDVGTLFEDLVLGTQIIRFTPTNSPLHQEWAKRVNAVSDLLIEIYSVLGEGEIND